MILLFVDLFAPHSVDLESLAELVELVLEDQVDLLLEMLSGLAEGAIEFQRLEVDVFFGHEVDEFINAEAVFFGTC